MISQRLLPVRLTCCSRAQLFMPSYVRLVYLGKCSGKSTDLLMNVNYYAGCGLNQPFCSAILAVMQTKGTDQSSTIN